MSARRTVRPAGAAGLLLLLALLLTACSSGGVAQVSLPACGQPNLTVQLPAPTATVSFPMEVKGVVDNRQASPCGPWIIFEAEAGTMEVQDINGTVVGRGILRAQGEWMTAGPVPVIGTIALDREPANNTARLVITSTDPSGAQTPQVISIPIVARR